MEPLIILVGTFLLSLCSIRLIKKNWRPGLAGRIGMSSMLLFTGVAHFMYPEGMALMLPGFIPFKMEVVYATGIIEIAAAVGLLIPRFQHLIAWLLILFFIMIIPANIFAAIHHVNIRTAGYDGAGVDYLWFRVPLQIFFIGWVYYFGVRRAEKPEI